MKGSNIDAYDFIVKLLILGDSTVGKSALLNKFCDNVFSSSHIATIGFPLFSLCSNFHQVLILNIKMSSVTIRK